MKTKRKILIIIGCLLVVYILIKYKFIREFFTLENIKNNGDILETYARENYVYSLFLYMSSSIVLMILGLPLVPVLSILGGFLFNTFMGSVYSNIAITTGSVLSFLGAKYLFGNWVQKKYKKKLTNFNKSIKERGNIYFILIRLIVVIPSFVINLLAGASKVSTWTFAWTTFIGLMPEICVYAYAGDRLADIESLKEVFSFEVLSVFLLIFFIILIPNYLYKKK